MTSGWVHSKLSPILNHIRHIENIGFHIEDYVFQLCAYVSIVVQKK